MGGSLWPFGLAFVECPFWFLPLVWLRILARGRLVSVNINAGILYYSSFMGNFKITDLSQAFMNYEEMRQIYLSTEIKLMTFAMTFSVVYVRLKFEKLREFLAKTKLHNSSTFFFLFWLFQKFHYSTFSKNDIMKSKLEWWTKSKLEWWTILIVFSLLLKIICLFLINWNCLVSSDRERSKHLERIEFLEESGSQNFLRLYILNSKGWVMF